MDKSFRWKLVILVVVLAASIWVTLPTFRLYGMPEAARNADTKEANDLRTKAVKLGLDLQGGMHLVLALDTSNLRKDDVPRALDRAIQILRNRIDRFNVREPLIQKQGNDRILMQLPGVADKTRALDLVGQTAQLEFKIVKDQAASRQVLESLDRAFARKRGVVDDSTGNRPLVDLLHGYPEFQLGGAMVATEDAPEVEKLLASVKLDSILPADASVVLSKPAKSKDVEERFADGTSGRVLYVLNRRAAITGAEIKTAIMRIGLDANQPNASGVTMTMTSKGASLFRRVTSDNVGKQLAIVLDDKVMSAPSIRERIPGGEARITGSFSADEAGDLAIVLQVGALPAPIKVDEERTVGPSLGKDSVRTGLGAAWVGTAVVVLFMLFFYRASGLVSIFALVLNIFLVFAGMAALRSTLTLPGIAGLVLTVGMAVDANVLIFERIREELRSGKRVKAAIDAGYHRAWTTILDSNLTTLISAAVLYQFGTGPIKGFAVTLGLGIIANLYTAVLVSRMVFDIALANRNPKTLSI
jgi:protein-export membrane protein SecD